VHRNPLEMRIDRGEQADDFDVTALAQNVETPRAIFAAAPREKDLALHRKFIRTKIKARA